MNTMTEGNTYAYTYRGWRLTITLAYFVLAIFVASTIGAMTNQFFGAMAFLVLFMACIGATVKRVPAQPFTYWVLSILGRPKQAALSPGFWFLPGPSLLFGWLAASGKDVSLPILDPDNPEKKELVIETPKDKVGVRFPVTVMYSFDPSNPLPYVMRLEGKENVETHLSRIAIQALRTWVRSRNYGPQRYEDAMAAGIVALNVIFKALVGNNLKRIPSDIPTEILLNYFSSPKQPPSEQEEIAYGKNWGILEQRIKNLGDDGRAKLESAVKERLAILVQIQRGEASFPVKSLGIVIKAITLGDIEPVGEVARIQSEATLQGIRNAAKDLEWQNRDTVLKRLTAEVRMDPKLASDFYLTVEKLITVTKQEKKFAFENSNLETVANLLLALLNKGKLEPVSPQGGTR